MSVTAEESWAVEPELRDQPPRRITAADRVDYNQPPTRMVTILSVAIILIGVSLFFVALLQKQWTLMYGGIPCTLLGLLGIILVPAHGAAYATKVTRLVEFGIPVPARLLAIENRGVEGGIQRFVKFQYQVPGVDEPRHGDSVVEYSALPKTIPSLVTALVDPETNACELYMALPIMAVAKPLDRASMLAAEALANQQSVTEMGAMDLEDVQSIVVKRKVDVVEESSEPKRESYE